ncbi:dihydrofolate reductase family protein [Roseobacter insulae]|uniref:dihydrofolate reductase family protein n=1 Tax=Roseobacter insulae TaxID=2859783 RepID=UPI0021519C58|nr:hypothetical protein [Roseobacter insulae]
MHPIIYDVAVSLDGFISGPSGDVSKFAPGGPVVVDYRARLDGYATAIMGRGTYEFGYEFGLEAGKNPNPHMDTFVFSRTLDQPVTSDVAVYSGELVEGIAHVRARAKGPVYLCGG